MLTKGCHGSALTAQAASETCKVCLERVACFEAARKAQEDVLRLIPVRLKVTAADDVETALARVQKHFRTVLDIEPEREKKKTSRVTGLKEKFAANGIDLAGLRSRKNPFPEDGSPLSLMSEMICEGVPFTPKDMVEYLFDRGCTLKQSSAASEVSRFVALLVEEGVLKKDKRVLCLA